MKKREDDLHIRVTKDQRRKLKQISKEDRRSVSNVAQLAIDIYIKNKFQNRLNELQERLGK